MRKEIYTLCRRILDSSFIKKLENNEFDKIISLDMEDIVKKYNDGLTMVLEDEDLQEFLADSSSAYFMVQELTELRRLLSYKAALLEDIRKQKDKMTYSPDDAFVEASYIRNSVVTYSEVLTYAEVLRVFELAERILSDKKTYQILNFYLKNESLKGDIKDRQLVEKCIIVPSETRSKILGALIFDIDYEVGIIKVNDTQEGVSVHAGTKKDMELSEIIGLPFESDMDCKGYSFGPHGDYYREPRKVEKSFHTENLTPLHKRMIIQEKAKRLLQRLTAKDEEGFIIYGDEAMKVSYKFLCDAGIDPKSIGWKPLNLSINPRGVRDIAKTLVSPISTREQISLAKDRLLKGRK